MAKPLRAIQWICFSWAPFPLGFSFLRFPLGLASVGPVQDGLESVESSNCRFSVELSCFKSDGCLLHIVIQNLLWIPAKVLKRVLVASNQRVCAHIRYKFDIPNPRIPQYHEKAVQLLPLFNCGDYNRACIRTFYFFAYKPTYGPVFQVLGAK